MRIDQVVRKAWEIVDNITDERIRLQALALIDQCNTPKMDMVTKGTVLKDALNLMNNKTDKLNESIRKLETYGDQEQEQDEILSSFESESKGFGSQSEPNGEAETTNDVF